MTQDAFIQQLRHELRSLPKQVVDEIVADYREYIGDALAAGRSEAEVVAALGDPVRLARELKAQATFRQWETRRSFGNLMRVFLSIAGLGLMQLLLLVPFMFYLLFLTMGYVISGALVVTGLATVVLLGSHQLFGWPSVEQIPFSFEHSSGHGVSAQAGSRPDADSDDDDDDDDDDGKAKKPAAAANNQAASDQAASDQAAGKPTQPAQADSQLAQVHIPDFRVDGERFELRPQPGTRISIVTAAGPLEIRNRDGKLKIESVGGARELFTVTGDTWSIRRADVVALDLKTDNGDKVSAARVGSAPNAMAWDISDGGDRLSFVEGGSGGPHLAVHSGEDSVEVDRNHVSIASGSDKMLIVGPHGSNIGTLLYGFAMLVGGAFGLWLCVRLTCMTWRGLVRYVRRQAERLTEKLELGGLG
ncbi:DUF1700 domain-containing protein [Paraburkholderia sp. J12]|uniref:DUF1700 domain-containing protein n=1 Tax=Paraburkholderia sp. J12 TaxID=2805432 RepID=UPI002ABE55C6|nr:DUF1700 domain-containing protein [Paraburkholderia sp. J12]